MPLRAAVVGAGAISLQHLAFLAASPRAELAAVCELSPVSARIAARRYGADRWFTDVDDMLALVDPDVVHVLTPPHTHGPIVSRCLAVGAHVICEKPMAPTAEETEKLLADADSAGRHLVESHNYRFNDEVIQLRRLIDDGRLGAVRDVDIRLALGVRDPGNRFADASVPSPIHTMPAGVLHDFITHLAYLLIDLTGHERFDRIASAVSNHGGGELFRFDDLDALVISSGRGAEVPVHGRIRFSCHTRPELFSLAVRGEHGQASTDLFHPHLELTVDRSGGQQLTPIINHIVNGAALTRSGVRNFGRKLLQHSPYHGLARFLDLTYCAIDNGDPPPVTPADVLAAARLVDLLIAPETRL